MKMAVTVKIEITADTPEEALAAARDIGASRVPTEQVNGYPPNVEAPKAAPPLTDAELGQAQANVAQALARALLTVAQVPDINSIESTEDAANFAAALRSLHRAGKEADNVLSRYAGEWTVPAINTNPAVTYADIIKAAAKAAQVEASRMPDTEPHNNS